VLRNQQNGEKADASTPHHDFIDLVVLKLYFISVFTY